LEAFRQLKDEHGDALVDNYRPTMPMAGRQVTEFEVVDFAMKPGAGQVDDHKPFPDAADTDGKKSPAPPAGDIKKNSAVGLTFSSSILGLTAAVMMLQLKSH